MNERRENGTMHGSEKDNLPLINAVFVKDKEAVLYLLTHNTVDTVHSMGLTPSLFIAAQLGYLEIAELLIKAGADVHFKLESGQTILWTAACQGHASIVQLLLNNGANKDELSYNSSPLYISAQNNHLGVLNVLLEAGCAVNLVNTSDTRTALFVACFKGYTEIVAALLNHKAEVDLADNQGLTPLMAAAMNGHESVIRQLVQAGTHLDAISSRAHSALMLAQSFGQHEVANILRKSGASPNVSFTHLGKQFSSYLDLKKHSADASYDLILIQDIKRQLDDGLCHGFSLLFLATSVEQWSSIYEGLTRLSSWDGTLSTLDKELDALFHSLLSDLLWLHNRHHLLSNQSPESLIRFVSEKDYEVLLNLGALMSRQNLDYFLKLIVKPHKKINIGSINRVGHMLLVTQVAQKYLIIDSNASIGPIEVDTIEALADKITLLLEAPEEGFCMNLQVTVYEEAPSCDREEYLTYKAVIIDKLYQAMPHNPSPISALYCAIAADDEYTVAYLLAQEGTLLNPETEYCYSPLYIAVQKGNLSILKQLNDSYSNVNWEQIKGHTYLSLAATYGLTSVIEFLIDHGANPNKLDFSGRRPIFEAALWSHLPALHALLKAGAYAYCPGETSNAPLYIACFRGNLDIIRYLVEYGAPIDQKECRPLDMAITQGHLHVVHFLVQQGASLVEENSLGQAPLFIAQESGQIKILEYIKNTLMQKNVVSANSFFTPQVLKQQDENTMLKDSSLPSTKSL
ncbi:MAG: ankyrin repeat domain-containing protein [Legionella sp.]|nr:ankyrin repeat domain-containing protein [Legionella sp.]